VTLTHEMVEGLLNTICSEHWKVLDRERSTAVIKQVVKHDQALQKNLRQLAENFDYPNPACLEGETKVSPEEIRHE
jgi:hypothetical protein